MKQRQGKRITILIAFVIAISFSASVFVHAAPPADEHKHQAPQHQAAPQKAAPQQKQLQRPAVTTPGGPATGTQPRKPSVQPGTQPRKPSVQPGTQPGKPGVQPGTQPRKPSVQPGTQPGKQPGRNTTINKTTININQSPQDRRRVLTERHKEIRPEHNARAVSDFRGERARFKPMSKSVIGPSHDIQRRVFEKHHFHPETYHARRAVFYETYGYHTPGWAYRLQPRYGLWDTVALAFILAHAADEQYALWYYSHRVDPDVIAWRQEMNRLAVENAELANQLAVMDAQAQALQTRGAPVDNSYVPPEMEDVALAPEVAAPAQDENVQTPAPPPVQAPVAAGPPPPVVFQAPPSVVVIPGTYVYRVPDIDADILYYGGYWYRPYGGLWYRSLAYSGPWLSIGIGRVPRLLLGLPGDYRLFPYERRHLIPYRDLHRNWRSWERGRHWDRDERWRGHGDGHRGDHGPHHR